MANIIIESFGINIQILRVLLLYPPEKYQSFYKVGAYLIFGFLMFHVPILGILYFLLEENIDQERLGDNAFVLAGMCCYLCKLLPFLTNAEEIKKCIHYFETSVKIKQDQRKILAVASKTCRRNSKIFLVCVIGSIIIWSSKPMFSSNNNLPIDIWLPFDYKTNIAIHYAIYLWLTLGVAYASMACAVVEPLVAGLAGLAAAHFIILKDNLMKLNQINNSVNLQYSIRITNFIFLEIKEILKHYESILKFVSLYQNCFSQVVFSQLAGSIFVLGFCCLQLIKQEPMSVVFFTLVNNVCLITTQIFFYCYYGAILIAESESLTNAVYMTRWYEYDIKSRKALILLMERSKRPATVTVGKMLVLSLVTFTSIIRKAYSVLAVFTKQ